MQGLSAIRFYSALLGKQSTAPHSRMTFTAYATRHLSRVSATNERSINDMTLFSKLLDANCYRLDIDIKFMKCDELVPILHDTDKK
jgi:hypothetical protein